MPASPILGGFSKSFSTGLSDNEAYNLFVELLETKDGKVPGALIGAAGLDLIGSLGDGPIRGVHKLLDTLYVVSGPEVWSLTPNGIATQVGQLGIANTPVSMFDNGQQMMIVDGVGGWLVPGGFPLTGGSVDAGGGLYAVNDTITLKAATGTQSSFAIINVTAVVNNPVTAYTLPSAGTTYNTATNVATTAIQAQPGIGSGLTLNITASNGAITAASIGAGGSGYAVGDTGTIGTGNAIYRVETVSAGVVTAVLIINPGTSYATAAGVTTTAALAVPTNIGTGLTLNITAAAGPISASTLVNGGQNYAVGNVGLISGGSGDATYLVTAVGAVGTVTGFSVSQPGAVASQPLTFTQQSTSGSGSGFILSSPTFGASIGLVPVTLPFPNPVVGGISDGFGLLVFLGSQNIAQSNELDLSTWDPLSFGVSDSSPDNCISLAVIHDEAYILKEKHTEVWVDGGIVGFAFELLTSARMEHGCMAPFSPAVTGESLCWLSRNEQGQGIVVEARGYTVVPISTQALVAEFDTYANLGDAIGYGRQQGGHVFYVLTFPEADRTWAYDVTASQMAGYPFWHRLASFKDGAWHRHPGNCFTPWRGSVTLVNQPSQYQPNSVTISAARLATDGIGLNGLPLAFPAAVFSVWIDIPDAVPGTGIVFSNQGAGATPGLLVQIQNDQTGTPQITVEAWDQAANPIVSAAYDFTGWSAWVNVLVSIDTASQQLQVYANTVVGEVLIETALTPASITWTSSNQIAPAATQPFHLTTVAGTANLFGSLIAQLVVPSDAFGTPNGAIADWVNGKVYLLSSTAPSIRSYSAELVTQEPVLSAALTGFGPAGVDPVTGAIIMMFQGDIGSVTNKIDPTTLSVVGSFGVNSNSAEYPQTARLSEAIFCVGVGTIASGGSVQVGYALIKASITSGSVAVIRTDTMTAAGANPGVVTNGTDNRGFMCRGVSGPAGGSVFLTDAGVGGASIPLYTVAIAPGAETYNISSWPTANPFITSGTVGQIAAASVDPTATSIESTGSIGYDSVNNIVVMGVQTNGTGATNTFLIGVNPANASVLWVTPGDGIGSLNGYRISGEFALLNNSGSSPFTGTGSVFTSTGGSLTTSTLNGLSTTFAAGDDLSGLMVLATSFTQASGSPVPVSGTPTSFSGWAILVGVKDPTQATIADLWFGHTYEFVDLTVESNRRNFISVTGGAQNLGSDGSAPFGVTPPVFLTSDGTPATFADNNGRGGPFTVSSGTLATGATDPPGSTMTTTTVQQNSPGAGVLGDYQSGNLYAFNPKTLTDNGAPRRWLRRWRALPQGSEAAKRFSALYIDMQTGLNVPDGANPQCVLRWSDDGGRTWSDARIVAVGPLGVTAQTVKFNRLGSTRRFGGSDRIFELSSTDPFLLSILGAEVDAS